MKRDIKRSLRFSLEEVNKSKKGFLGRLWEDYKKILEYFIDVGWNGKRLPRYEDVKIMNLDIGLSRRYIGCALVQAQVMLKSCFRRLRKHRADYVGAVNILRRFLSATIPEESMVPLPARSNFIGLLDKCL
jgi:hypothetical protein